ncbi:MAG: YraN family protein [Gammaproteobacteria bacterium]
MKLKNLLTNKRGQWAEKLAEKYLTKQSLKLIERNYSCRRGEIDLIMWEKNTIAFVEVRYRKNDQYGGGIESIDFHKQEKIRKTAMHFLQNNHSHQDYACRFDAMIISGEPDQPTLNWIKNAF